MENQNRKRNIRFVKVSEMIGIGIEVEDLDEKEKESLIKDIENINFQFIKYHNICFDRQTNKNYHFVRFVDIPKSMIDEVCALINQQLEKENYRISFYDCLNYVVSLFRKKIFPSLLDREIRGDICEALFILKAKKELNIDLTKYYYSDDNLYDFYFDDKKICVDIKGTTKISSNIKINYRQLIEKEFNRDFYVVEYQLVNDKETGKNIFELYNEIGLHSEIIKSKFDKWNNYKNLEEDGKKKIETYYLVNLDNTKIFKIKNESLPKINVTNDNLLIDLELTISTKNCNDGDINEVIRYIE